ncbi:MAG: hypothetical protein JWQ81_923 [Amycolatopsis sp.]|uniref:hypothetical protein n=1 Tax=Amycolatopsis sp. TaxID=37632 RepID=UPI00261802F0|nr:hypothetical protein [Amycolatopsis sp.]MCU1680184.1 hypothetical protein [Amycolatopsis sp.]
MSESQVAGFKDNSLTDQQERLARRLTLVGSGPAILYREACELMAEQPARPSATHLIGHLLREVESAVRSVLQPPGTEKLSGHVAKVQATLQAMGIDEEEPVSRFWMGIARADSPQRLVRWAHRNGLDAPHPADKEFLTVCAGMQALLERLMDEFEPKWAVVGQRLDSLLGLPTPSTDDAKAVRQRIPSDPVARGYFFDRAGIQWLGPLVEAGFFSAPPDPIIDEDDGTVVLPFWPDSRYLARVAPEAPSEVVAVAAEVPHSRNSRINYDLVSIAVAVPVEESLRLVDRIIDEIQTGPGVLIPQQVGVLSEHLAAGGHPDTAVRLLRALLDTVPAVGGSAGEMDTYTYADILRSHVPALARDAGRLTITLLIDLLTQATSASVAPESPALVGPRRADWSTVWRPSVAGDSFQDDFDPTNTLVTAVRDTALQLIDVGEVSLSEIIHTLDAAAGEVFQRLALHVLAHRGGDEPTLVASHLLDPALLHARGVDMEYFDLARQRGTDLNQTDRDQLFELISAGPHLQDRIDGYTHSHREPPPEAMIHAWNGRWQRNRFAALRAALPPEWLTTYQQLVDEFGEPAEQTSVTGDASSGLVEPAPVSAGTLETMPNRELAAYLNEWQPLEDSPQGWAGATPRDSLSAAIEHDAAQRSRDAMDFSDLPPTYLAAILEGLRAGASQGSQLHWPEVLELCAQVDASATAELAASSRGLRTWRDARMTVLNLLLIGLSSADMPTDERDGIWSLIASAVADPEPGVSEEDRLLDGGFGLQGVSMNTIRPVAIRVAIAWAFWARSNDSEADVSVFLKLLARHLDPQVDPSQGVRWIFGEYYAALVEVDYDWAATNRDRVFPAAPESLVLWETAWTGFLSWGSLNHEVWLLLEQHYRLAVERIHSGADDRLSLAREFELGKHLVDRYMAGDLDLNDDSLLRLHYCRVSDIARANLLEFVGHSIVNGVGCDVERLASLWNYRLEAARDAKDGGSRELRGFGRWFASGVFDNEWALRQLLEVLTITDLGGTEDHVIKRLATLVDAYLVLSLKALEALIRRRERDGAATWAFSRQLENIKGMVTAGLESPDSSAQQLGSTIISLLFRHGYDIRDLQGER